MCGPTPCAPMHDACTWSEAHRQACEARHVLAMPFPLRRPYLQAIGQSRGQAAMQTLTDAVQSQWKQR